MIYIGGSRGSSTCACVVCLLCVLILLCWFLCAPQRVQTATLLYEMQRRGKGARFGVVSMCIGSGKLNCWLC